MIGNETDSETKQNLKNAFSQLSDRQKEILFLKYYSELDYKEISKVMDMNYQSARNLVSRALAKLSKVMMIFILLLFARMTILAH